MILSLAFLIALVFDVTSSVPFLSNTSTFGRRVIDDRLIIEKRVFAPSKRGWSRVYLESFIAPPGLNISQIICKDMRVRIPYGKCKIAAGGPLMRSVILSFRSPINKPVDFTVTVYGYLQ